MFWKSFTGDLTLSTEYQFLSPNFLKMMKCEDKLKICKRKTQRTDLCLSGWKGDWGKDGLGVWD